MRRLTTLASSLVIIASMLSAAPQQQQARAGLTAQGGWGRELNPKDVVPASGFHAFYFDRRDPHRIVFQENVPDIAIKYAWAEFHGIDSPNFGAYWVGRVNFAHRTTKQISISQSWSKARIRIDGRVVVSGSTFTHEFSAGRHLIEVEYVNNWHTVEFKVTLEDVVRPIDERALASVIRKRGLQLSPLYLGGLYESTARNTRVAVTVPRGPRPSILWLTSYEAIDWVVPAGGSPGMVVVSSYKPGSRVSGIAQGRVVHLSRGSGLYSATRQCSCSGSHFHCESDEDIGDAAKRIEAAAGVPVTGYAVRYSADRLMFTPFNAGVVAGVIRQRAIDEVARKQCTARANPDFDQMFNR